MQASHAGVIAEVLASHPIDEGVCADDTARAFTCGCGFALGTSTDNTAVIANRHVEHIAPLLALLTLMRVRSQAQTTLFGLDVDAAQASEDVPPGVDRRYADVEFAVAKVTLGRVITHIDTAVENLGPAVRM